MAKSIALAYASGSGRQALRNLLEHEMASSLAQAAMFFPQPVTERGRGRSRKPALSEVEGDLHFGPAIFLKQADISGSTPVAWLSMLPRAAVRAHSKAPTARPSDARCRAPAPKRTANPFSLIGMRAQQAFTSIQDLALRVPELRKRDLSLLAQIGALNSLGEVAHRRDALWQVEYAGRPAGPLLNKLPEQEAEPSPLQQMTIEERLVADFAGTGVTLGPHPMAFHRAELTQMDILAAGELAGPPNGKSVQIAGCVIARQRPGTANGFVFLSIEDETGIANAIITPAIYEQFKHMIIYEKFLLIGGELQNQQDVISVKAHCIRPLEISDVNLRSHDFH